MSNAKGSSSEVHIGNITGGIHGSIIAGGDVSNATISIGGKEVSAAKEPKFEELQQLLTEVQQELAEITSKPDLLKAISASAPFTAQGAEAVVQEAAQDVQPKTDEKKAKSVQQN